MKDQLKNWGAENVLAAVILVLVLILGGSALGNHLQNKQDVAGIESQASPTALKTISYDGQDGKNALELLKASNDVQTQDSSLGIFVSSINGTENTNDTFWMFYVNGQLAPTGADQYQTKNGDKIEWRYEKFQ